MLQAKQIKLAAPEDQKLRVAAYCRVSSNMKQQQLSFDRQVEVYSNMIERRPEWTLAGIFADEGFSGTSAENRPEFQRMIRACEQRQIDLIITKSVSRFARNVQEALIYVRKLKLLGIGVQFEKEGINTCTLGDEMLLNTFAAIAQEESKSISQNQRHSIVKRMELGEYVDSNAPYGFRLVEKQIQVYEPEAKVVRWIFRKYLDGWSTSEIANQMNADVVPTKSKKAIWRPAKIAYILSNERYVGDCMYQKTYRDTTVPFKQFKNRGEEDRYYVTDTHEPIVDRSTFEEVQKLLQKRRDKFAKSTVLTIYPLTSRIHCCECGSSFRRKVRGGTAKWVCARHQEDSRACSASYYDEDRIYDGFVAMVNKLRFGEERILDRVIGKLEAAGNAYRNNDKAAAQIAQEIADLNEKKLRLEKLRGKQYLPAEVYCAQAREIDQQITKLKLQRQKRLDSSIMKMLEDVKHLKRLIEELEDPLESFDEKIFREIVRNIMIDTSDHMTIEVLGGLRFTEQI